MYANVLCLFPQKKKKKLYTYYYYYYNNFVYHTTRCICLAIRLRAEIIFTEDKEYLWAPLDFDIGFPRESDRTLGEFNSDAKLGWKSKQTPVTYLQLYIHDNILHVLCIFFTIECSIFFLRLKSSASYYLHQRRHRLFILTV